MDRGGGERVLRVADAKTPEMQKRIFEERLTREARHNAPRSRNFQVNPVVRNVGYGFEGMKEGATKPNLEDPADLAAGHIGSNAPKLRDFSQGEPVRGTDEYIENQVAKLRSAPVELRAAPLTSSHAVGWLDGARLVGWANSMARQREPLVKIRRHASASAWNGRMAAQALDREPQEAPPRTPPRPQSALGYASGRRSGDRSAPQRPQSALGTPEKRSPAGSKQGSSGRGAEKAEAAERPQSAAARLAPERVTKPTAPTAPAAPAEPGLAASPRKGKVRAHVTRPGSATPGYRPAPPGTPRDVKPERTPRASKPSKPDGAPRPGTPRSRTASSARTPGQRREFLREHAARKRERIRAKLLSRTQSSYPGTKSILESTTLGSDFRSALSELRSEMRSEGPAPSQPPEEEPAEEVDCEDVEVEVPAEGPAPPEGELPLEDLEFLEVQPPEVPEVPANGYPFLTENGDLIQEREAIGFPFVEIAEPDDPRFTGALAAPPVPVLDFVLRERDIMADIMTLPVPTRRWNRCRQMTEIGRFADSMGKTAFKSSKAERD